MKTLMTAILMCSTLNLSAKIIDMRNASPQEIEDTLRELEEVFQKKLASNSFYVEAIVKKPSDKKDCFASPIRAETTYQFDKFKIHQGFRGGVFNNCTGVYIQLFGKKMVFEYEDSIRFLSDRESNIHLMTSDEDEYVDFTGDYYSHARKPGTLALPLNIKVRKFVTRSPGSNQERVYSYKFDSISWRHSSDIVATTRGPLRPDNYQGEVQLYKDKVVVEFY